MIPVGAGWSFYLNKSHVNGKVLLTHDMAGLQSNGRWGSGTRIKDVQKSLTSSGLTLTSYPSSESGTLGGWIASGSHGSGGTLWKSNFDRITVKDLYTGQTFDAHVKDIFNDRKTIDEQHRYLIMDVEIYPVENVWCKKQAYKINEIADVAFFLKTESYLRMVQVGKRGIMGLLWTPLDVDPDTIDHTDPHFGSQVGLWIQADLLSIVQSSKSRYEDWFEFPVEPKRNFTSKIRLSDANAFTCESPNVATPIGLLFRNFEVFVLEYTITDDVLFKLCNAIADVFTLHVNGRCEVRCGKSKLFLDFVVLRTDNFTAIFETILSVLGPVEIVLHKGKAQVDTYPFIPACLTK